MEEKPNLHVLKKYTYYRKFLDEVTIDRMKLEKRKIVEEQKVARIMEDGLPKKLDDPGCFVLPLKVNDTTPLNALANIGESVSVMP